MTHATHTPSLESATKLFESHFGLKPAARASAPGRLEVLGNHTDYNEGFVLSCAVELRTYAVVAQLPGTTVRIISGAAPKEQQFDLSEADAPRQPGTPKRWADYIRGVVAALGRRGVKVPAFALAVDSSVPLSAGMSSSAALEISVQLALLKMLGQTLTPGQMAAVGQEAESRAVGAQTGLMDQLTSTLGRKDGLLMSEYRDLTTSIVPMSSGYTWVVVDTGEKHDLAEDYNLRRASCERTAAKLAAKRAGVKTLRDVAVADLDANKDALGEDGVFARHPVEENARVHEAVALLGKGDVAAFGKLLFDSHQSSRVNFRNSSDRLDELVEYAAFDKRCIGARLSGGGFGGISIHLVRQAEAEGYAKDIARHFEKIWGKQPWNLICPLGDGARVE